MKGKTVGDCIPWRGLAVGVVLVLLLLGTVPGMAQTGPDTMNFQGRLLDAGGAPVTEPRCMRFRLCGDANCIEPWWPDPVGPFEHHLIFPESGPHTAGLFTVALGSIHGIEPVLLYDHDTLFLEIGVAPDVDPCYDQPEVDWHTMEPRSQLGASAYAQRSRRVRTEESDVGNLVHVVNVGPGGGIYAKTESTTNGAAAGTFHADGSSGETRGILAQVDSPQGTGVRAEGGYHGVYGEGTDPSGITYGVYGYSGGSNGTGVLGKSQSQTGVRGESVNGIGVHGSSLTSHGVYGHAGTNNDLVYGVYGQSVSSWTGAAGVYGLVGANDGKVYGVHGYNSSHTSESAGVYGYAHYNGYGVHGRSTSTTSDSAAGFFEASGATGRVYGVRGKTASTTDLSAAGSFEAAGTSGRTYGVHAVNDSAADLAAAGYFHAAGSGGETRGVYGVADSPNGDGVRGEGAYHGVYGEGTDSTGITYGVYGKSDGYNGYGVWGQGQHQDGVHGLSTNSNGVYGATTSGQDGTAGVYGVATATDGETYGVYGQALSPEGYGVYSMGDAHVAGDLSWTAKTSYIAIGATGFDYYMGRGYSPEITTNQIVPPPGCTVDQMFRYVAHLQLPHGATLTSLAFTWRDGSATHDSQLEMLRTDLVGGSPLILADIYTSGSANSPSSTTHTWVPGDAFAVVDNSSNTYLLDLHLYCDTVFHAAIIEYTIEEPY